MKYVRVKAQHRGKADWVAEVPLDNGTTLPVFATSKPTLEYAVYRAVEEAEGWNSFSVIWLDD